MATQPPVFKPFTLALVQLGQVGEDKAGMVIASRSRKVMVLIRPGP